MIDTGWLGRGDLRGGSEPGESTCESTQCVSQKMSHYQHLQQMELGVGEGSSTAPQQNARNHQTAKMYLPAEAPAPAPADVLPAQICEFGSKACDTEPLLAEGVQVLG